MVRSFSFQVWLLLPLLGAVPGCVQKPTTTAPVIAQASPQTPVQPPDAEEVARVAARGEGLNERLAAWDGQGHYSAMVTAARTRLAAHPEDGPARYHLARGYFYNGDFAAAIVEVKKLMQTPQYQQDAKAQQLLRGASYLAERYAGQKIEPVSWVKGDVTQQTDYWQAQGAALIAAKKYDEIERVAVQLTQKPIIFSDGSWALALFSVGLWQDTQDNPTEAQWKQSHYRVAAWNTARPKSQLAKLCLARSWTNGAWTARGDKFANQVPPEAWQIVQERQAQAAPIYKKMLSSPKAFSPLVYAGAQRYGRLDGAPRDWHDEVFRRAVTQFPNYTDFYRERALYLLPRWGGEPREWEADAAKSADAEAARSGQETGDRLYARIVWSHWDSYQDMRKETQIDWPRTKRGFDSILKQYPASLSAATIFMRLCYQWNEGAKARELLQKIGGRADSGNWIAPSNFARTRISLLGLSS